MEEKESQFTVIDRRKFTSEGEIRPEAANERAKEDLQAATSAPAPEAVVSSGIHAVPPVSTTAASQPSTESAEMETLQGPTAEESAESLAAYSETTRQMDEILRGKIPDGRKDTAVSFEHVIQSLYMTAVMHLGAGTAQGEKARIDLMGARQTIDMLEILAKKTVGNLTESEQRLLDSALFETRMIFLETTNAIARSAKQPMDPKNKR